MFLAAWAGRKIIYFKFLSQSVWYIIKRGNHCLLNRHRTVWQQHLVLCFADNRYLINSICELTFHRDIVTWWETSHAISWMAMFNVNNAREEEVFAVVFSLFLLFFPWSLSNGTLINLPISHTYSPTNGAIEGCLCYVLISNIPLKLLDLDLQN